MDRTVSPYQPLDGLYPPIEPFDQRWLPVGDGYQVYVEQCGHPQGRPVLVIHGGPGGGSSPMMRRFFDPRAFRIILFDQRGCGRSRPAGEVVANTTAHLLADIETIRRTLGIDCWTLFGGSWGATLALAYAIAHPERVAHLVLRGVFLGTQAELDWFYGGGAGRFFPDAWRQLRDAVPLAEQGNLITAYHRRLFSGDRVEEMRFGQIWTAWENALATIAAPAALPLPPGDHARIFARLENHYFHHDCFFEHDDWIMRHRPDIANLPATIVQGRYDMICPPHTAHRLADGWPRARLRMIPLAGHAMSEPGIAAALVAATDALRG